MCKAAGTGQAGQAKNPTTFFNAWLLVNFIDQMVKIVIKDLARAS